MAITYALSATLQNLRDDVRGFGEYQENPLPDTLLDSAIQYAIQDCHDEIVAIDESRAHMTATANIVSGTAEVALPADSADVLAVAVADTSTVSGYRALTRVMLKDRYTTDYPYGGSKASLQYDIEGANCILFPAPTFSETGGLLYVYTRMPPVLGASSDSWDGYGVVGWRKFVAFNALEIVADKADDPWKGWAKRVEQARLTLTRNARRNTADPTVVTFPGVNYTPDWWRSR